MTLREELAAFYRRCGFSDTADRQACTVPVYTGCLLVPLPNIETRHIYLKYHDLHHIVTGYSTGRIGEGEVSAWELGTGSMLNSPLLGTMNLIALSTGLVLQPKRMWRAFRRGGRSRNLYPLAMRERIDADHWPDLPALRQALLDSRRDPLPLPLRAIEFSAYAALAMLIHALIAIPAMITRVITDIGLGYSFIQAVKPTRRSDLY
ncbi:hypothetical protein SAMN05878276_0264 [Aquipseudomonas alcaligenes]|uniref:hypothetical protein n=1 Tax=Aquipseudomonas alcaligenes TaxID=43263 RepID=UPI000955C831|nr:hypothetical protein [Pseudomonas alcaligenes]SIR80588.1 hypothetical protein SAMN05878276_0264 [Pseudomonas alcaligenes]